MRPFKKTFLWLLFLILLISGGIFIVPKSPLWYMLRSSSVDTPCTEIWYTDNATKYRELLEAQKEARILIDQLADELISKNNELQAKNTEKTRVRTSISRDTVTFQNTFSSPGTALPNYSTTCVKLTAFNRAQCSALAGIEEKKNLFKRLNTEAAKLKSSLNKIREQKNKTHKALATLNTFIEEYEVCKKNLEELILITPNGDEAVNGLIDIQWKWGIRTGSSSWVTLELRDTNDAFVWIIASKQSPNGHYLWDGKKVCKSSVGTSAVCTNPHQVQAGKYTIVVSYTTANNERIMDESDSPVSINEGTESDTKLSSLDVIIPTQVNAGEAFDVTIRALKQDRTILSGYIGTVQLASLYGSEEDIISFKKYTFSVSDNGSHYIAKGITIKKAGKYMLRFRDEVAGKEATIEITAKSQGGTAIGTLETFLIDAPTSVNINRPFTLTVKALKQDGNILSGYRGTVSFVIIPSASSQANSFELNIPWTYTYTLADNGLHTFSQAITIKSAWEYTVSVYDQVTNINQSVTVRAQ